MTKLLFILLSICFGLETNDVINRPFKHAGAIESLIDLESQYDELILVQLDLANDSLYNIVNSNIPDLNLNIGPATYHRVFPTQEFNRLENILSSDDYHILKRPYILPNNSRQYWVEVKQGSNTQGTYTEDEAISYTCDCVGGASDCVKLGWDSWYNPLDYYGEAWWGFSPPIHSYVNEIRVTVRGAQCDDLPLWSETYMGMRDANGGWSEDYELSIEYADNIYVVPEVWSEGMLMPIVGSEDNYVIDQVTLQFFYTCLYPDSPNYVVSSDGNYCDYVNISWESPDDNDDVLGYNLYRDQELINQFSTDNFSFTDYSASEGIVHEYCVVSVGECGESEQSCNTGYRKTEPNIVESTDASDGLFEDYVLITWESSENTDYYKVYRDEAWIALINPNSELEFIDEYINPEIEYNYCVEAMNECGESDWQCDIGYGAMGLGDINDDDSVDVLDVVSIVNIIMGYLDPTPSQVWSSDLNNDNQINIQDVILLVNMILD